MKNYLSLYLLLGLLLITGSCVKTSPYYTDFSDLHPIAELYTGGPTINNAWIATQAAPTDYTVEVNLASPNAASAPIVVTLELDTARFSELNDSVGNLYTLLPDSVYTVPSWKVTIDKGEHLAAFHIEVSSSKLNGMYVYILPLKITDASGITISANFGYGYWQVGRGNNYVGLYHSVGYKNDVGVITNINQDKYLYYADTTGGAYPPNTVIAQAGDDVTYLDYGIAMDLTVDPVSDTVLVTSDPNQGARGKIPLFNNGTCVYDPVNKVFTLNYAYVNAYGNTDSLHEVLTWEPLPQ
jgi:hypothetical protein